MDEMSNIHNTGKDNEGENNMDKSLIEEYFNDNGITASPFAQQDFLTRRKRYEKAQMTVANISDQEQARHFFNLYNIPFQITKIGQNKGKLRIMPLREKDLEVMRKAKRALRDNGYGWAAENYKVFRDDQDNAVVTFGPGDSDRVHELEGVIGDFEVTCSRWSIYGNMTRTVVCRLICRDE